MPTFMLLLVLSAAGSLALAALDPHTRAYAGWWWWKRAAVLALEAAAILEAAALWKGIPHRWIAAIAALAVVLSAAGDHVREFLRSTSHAGVAVLLAGAAMLMLLELFGSDRPRARWHFRALVAYIGVQSLSVALSGQIALKILNPAQLALSCVILLAWPRILLLPERGPEPEPGLDPDAYLAHLNRLSRMKN